MLEFCPLKLSQLAVLYIFLGCKKNVTPNATCMSKLEPILPFHVQGYSHWNSVRERFFLSTSLREQGSLSVKTL